MAGVNYSKVAQEGLNFDGVVFVNSRESLAEKTDDFVTSDSLDLFYAGLRKGDVVGFGIGNEVTGIASTGNEFDYSQLV